jgi:hypothetical protein
MSRGPLVDVHVMCVGNSPPVLRLHKHHRDQVSVIGIRLAIGSQTTSLVTQKRLIKRAKGCGIGLDANVAYWPVTSTGQCNTARLQADPPSRPGDVGFGPAPDIGQSHPDLRFDHGAVLSSVITGRYLSLSLR